MTVGATRWVDTQPELEELCAHLGAQPWIAADTEFLSDRSYFPRLCLVQVASAEVVACVDPLAGGLDLAPLWAVMREPAVTKVFHAAENDLAVLLPAVGAVPGPVFDTQVAGALLGYGPSVGYGALVEVLLGEVLDKSHARADWARRPLPGEAVRYAAADVRFLRDLFQTLGERLVERGRVAWAEEEFAALVDPARYREDPAGVWRRVRGQQRLDPVGVNVLRELAQWREVIARATNRPRRWVVGDEVLVEIARSLPADATALAAVRGFDSRRNGGDVAVLLEMVRHGRAAAQGPSPARARGPADRREAAVVDVLQAIVRTAAGEHELPESFLASASDLLGLVRGESGVRVSIGWRRDVVGDSLAAFLSGRASLQAEDGRLVIRPRADRSC